MPLLEPFHSEAAFLADVAAHPGDCAEQLHIWWLAQSGFLIRVCGKTLLLDPYLSDSLTKKYAATDKPHTRMMRQLVAPEKLTGIDIVTSSHNHTDHLDHETLRPLFANNPDLVFIAPEANRAEAAKRAGIDLERITGLDDGTSAELKGVRFTGIAAAHNSITLDAAGRNIFLGYVLEIGPWRIYHSGDTLDYDGLADRLKKCGPIDLALLPINGDKPERHVAGNMDGIQAAHLAHEIGARHVFPCHYDLFEFNTATPDFFVAECERLGQPYDVPKVGERKTLHTRR